MINKISILSLHMLLVMFIMLAENHVLFGQTLKQNDSIDNYINEYIGENNVPGFAACVIKNDSIVWSGFYGKADIKNDVGISQEGIMNIGSISKTFTATAAMQLWEQGLITLDSDVSEYVGFKIRNPEYPEKPITIFQILTHTSSIIDGKAYSESYSCGDPTMSLNDWIFNNLSPDGIYYNDGDSFAKWEPGGENKYSNVAFGLLGLIVEKISKTPFNVYCKQNIFYPLGMQNTGWFLSEIDTNRYIKPYGFITEENRNRIRENKLYPKASDFKVGSFVENCLYSFPNYPDGLVRTSIQELSLYLTAMMNGGELNGGNILKKETIKKMLSLQIEGNNSQGLCWRRKEIQSKSGTYNLWGHSGGDPGITTHLFFNPDNKIGVITFQNRAIRGADKIVERLYLAVQDF